MLLNINYKPKKIYIPESRIFILGEGIENEGVFFSPPTVLISFNAPTAA